MLHLKLFKKFKDVKTDFIQLRWRCTKKVWRWGENLP